METKKKVPAAATAKGKQATHAEKLAEKIQFFHDQHQKVRQRARFQHALDELKEVEINPELDDFTGSRSYEAPRFHFKVNNHREAIVQIAHPETVLEMRDFLISKIEQKIADLDKAILA